MYAWYMEREMRVREVRDQLGRRVDAAHYGGEATVITSSGEKRAVLVPYEWYQRVCVQQAAGKTSPRRRVSATPPTP